MFEASRRMRAAFELAGPALGLSLAGRTSLKGEIDGRRVRYGWSADSSGSGSWCNVRYRGGPLGAHLLIRRRNVRLPQWRKSVVETGDESFDVLLFVKTSKPDELSLLLDQKLRRQILDLAFAGTMRITDRSVGLRWRRAPQSASEITERVHFLRGIAENLERIRGGQGRQRPNPPLESDQPAKRIDTIDPAAPPKRKRPPKSKP